MPACSATIEIFARLQLTSGYSDTYKCSATIEIFARLQPPIVMPKRWHCSATIEIFARLQPIQKSHSVMSCATTNIKLHIL